MFRMSWCLFILSIFVLLSCETLSYGQNSTNELLDKRLTVQVKEVDLRFVLERLALDHNIPIGLEMSSTEAYTSNLVIDVEKDTLRKILDSIIQQQSAYRWEIRDGVINFTPKRDRYEFVVAFLDLNINCFSSNKDSDEYHIRNNIFKLPEVKDLMDLKGVSPSRFPDSYTHTTPHNGVDLSISNSTIKGILNKMARESNYKIWVVDMGGRNNDKLTISF